MTENEIATILVNTAYDNHIKPGSGSLESGLDIPEHTDPS
jgi:hypothetical protein